MCGELTRGSTQSLLLSSLTFYCDVHAPKLDGTDYLAFHVPLVVYEYGGQVSVRIVGDTGCGDALQEFGSREFGGQL